MRSNRFGAAFALAGALACPAAALAQDAICCMEIIGLDGPWFGAIRLENCQDYFNKAAPATLARMCAQRRALPCIDTSRCDSLPPSEKSPPKDAAKGGDAPPFPPDPDRDGVADGFGMPPSTSVTPLPPSGGVSPPRLVYLVRARSSGGGAPLTALTVYLDRSACAVPLGTNGQPTNAKAADRVVRGRVVRADGRVRVEAEAASIKDGVVSARATGEATGGDRAAVAAATRAAAAKLKLVCSR
jgi:hypothetical protein